MLKNNNFKFFTETYAVQNLTKSKYGQYVCPFCGSGNGENKSGALTLYKDGFHCFSCKKSGDVLDLIGCVEHIPDYQGQLKRAEELFGVSNKSFSFVGKTQSDFKEQKEESVTYDTYFAQMHEHINETDYWRKRGLGEATVKRFMLGYDADWIHPNAQNKEKIAKSPRLIIPTGLSSYLARDVRPDATKCVKMRVGKTNIFNESALYESTKPLFVVEGEFDAMSITEVGGEAIGIGGTSGAKKLLEKIASKKPTQMLILAFDADEAGNKCTKEISEELIRMEVQFKINDDFLGCKDANEALCQDRDAFSNLIASIEKSCVNEEDEEQKSYLSKANSSFVWDIFNKKEKPFCAKTGFDKLDSVLNGGLQEGLYVIGAMTSVGKTTISLQIGDSIAKSDNDVLKFSLEMSREELIAKSVSRHTTICSSKLGKRDSLAQTMTDIKSFVFDAHSDEEKDVLSTAVSEYEYYANRIITIEGEGDLGTKEIRAKVQKHIDLTGRRPVVLIDYLQILAPKDVHMSEKQNIDFAVMELKRISRDFKIPVWVISSFNRTAYKEEVSLESFKESGGIEYSADVVIGLQYQNRSDINSEKPKYPRKIEAVILKNRNGSSGDRIKLSYYQKYNYMVEE